MCCCHKLQSSSEGGDVALMGLYLRGLQEESQLAKATKDSNKITVEQVHGLMSQVGLAGMTCDTSQYLCIVVASVCIEASKLQGRSARVGVLRG